MNNEFTKHNIELVQGKRNRYVVSDEGGKKSTLRTRADVVLFLNKNQEINLKPRHFVFKKNAKFSNPKPSKDAHEVCTTSDTPDEESNEEVSTQTEDKESEDDVSTQVDAEEVRGHKRRTKTDDGVASKIQRVSAVGNCAHDEMFSKVLEDIHKIREVNAQLPENLSPSSIEHLNSILTDLSMENDPVLLAKEICKCPELFAALKVIFRSKIDTEIELYSSSQISPPVTMIFPPSCDSNFYCSVINEAKEHMPNFLAFLVNIVDSNEQTVSPSFIIKLANIISELLSSKDKRHSTLMKLNTLHHMFGRSTVTNVQTFNKKGDAASYSGGMRMVKECAELSEYFKTSKYNLTLGTQLTMDNVDLVMKNKLEHFILCYSRADPLSSQHLSDTRPSFDLNKVTPDIVYLSDTELDYMNRICRVVIARKISSLDSGFSFVSKLVPFKPLHGNSEMFDKQEIFIEMLEPLNEMEHGDMARMLSMCQKLILSRLNTLTDFKYDDLIQITTNQTGSTEEIQNAEVIVHKLLSDWGEVLLGGDLLTVERIDQNKSLRMSNLSKFERLEFLGKPRIAVFHFRQNLLLKLYANLLPSMEDSNNPGSLNCFRALTEKAKDLSNRESKIKDSFEIHYQFLLSVCEVFLEEKLLKSFSDIFDESDLKKVAASMKAKEDLEIISFLDQIISGTPHRAFFDPKVAFEDSAEKQESDDLENMANVFVNVWFILRSLDFLTKSGDGEGIMAFKKNSLLLTLSLHSSSSKYVHKLFQEMIEYEKMSDRQKLRFSSGHFIKFHGRQTHGDELKPQDLNLRSEDIVCEWQVEKVKNSLKTLAGNYSEDTIDKKTKATALVNAIIEHDHNSLLMETASGPGTSWSRFEEDEIERFRKYVKSLKPFRQGERKTVTYEDRKLSRNLYSKLDRELVSQFFKMKIDNML